MWCECGVGVGVGDFICCVWCSLVHLKACMLAFYPEFEADAVVSSEVILLLDLSNSMKVHQTHTHTHTHTQHTHTHTHTHTLHTSPDSTLLPLLSGCVTDKC